MQSLLKDEAFIRAATGELQSYLLSDALYWQLSPLAEDRAAGGLVSLTPGNLLLSFKRVGACCQAGEPLQQFNEQAGQFARLRSEWRSAWLKKACREYSARLKLWDSFLSESQAEGGRLVDYAFQVRWRTILDLLAEDGVNPTLQQSAQLNLLDEKLKRVTCHGAFAWEEEAARAFPPASFWYLYRAQC